VGKDRTKKAIFPFSVGNINCLWCLRKIERPFESRIRYQYQIGDEPGVKYQKYAVNERTHMRYLENLSSQEDEKQSLSER
jgi:hypothetical protein